MTVKLIKFYLFALSVVFSFNGASSEIEKLEDNPVQTQNFYSFTKKNTAKNKMQIYILSEIKRNCGQVQIA